MVDICSTHRFPAIGLCLQYINVSANEAHKIARDVYIARKLSKSEVIRGLEKVKGNFKF
jgi:hypothetical protein